MSEIERLSIFKLNIINIIKIIKTQLMLSISRIYETKALNY